MTIVQPDTGARVGLAFGCHSKPRLAAADGLQQCMKAVAMAGASVFVGRRRLNGLFIADVILGSLQKSEEVHRVDEGNLELVPFAGVATVRILNRQRFRHTRTAFR